MPRRTDISSILIIGAASVGAAACAQTSDPVANSTDQPASEKRIVLDRIAAECSLPSTTFVLVEDAEIRIQPGPDANFESVDCALRRVREADLVKDLPMGFVGNEALR